MTNVTFEEDQIYSRRPTRSLHGGVTGLLMRLSRGLIKTQAQANVTMIIISLIGIGLSVFLLTGEETGVENFEPPAGYEIVRPEKGPPRLQQKQ